MHVVFESSWLFRFVAVLFVFLGGGTVHMLGDGLKKVNDVICNNEKVASSEINTIPGTSSC